MFVSFVELSYYYLVILTLFGQIIISKLIPKYKMTIFKYKIYEKIINIQVFFCKLIIIFTFITRVHLKFVEIRFNFIIIIMTFYEIFIPT